jgi:hypothetical protein
MASESSPTESVIHQAKVFMAMVMMATNTEARNSAWGVNHCVLSLPSLVKIRSPQKPWKLSQFLHEWFIECFIECLIDCFT